MERSVQKKNGKSRKEGVGQLGPNQHEFDSTRQY
jgi:hypothetical protein